MSDVEIILMEYIFELGDIVIYKKDNSFYKVIEVVKAGSAKTAIDKNSYTITNDEKIIQLVPAKDLELP